MGEHDTPLPRLPAHDTYEVRDDREVDDDAARLEPGRMANELVDLDRDEQRGRDHGQPLGPPPAVEEPNAFGDLERRVADRQHAEQSHLVLPQMAELVDEVVDPGGVGIELEPAGDVVCDVPEVCARL